MSFSSMKIGEVLTNFVIVFAVALLVSVAVTFLWSLIFHGAGTVNWGTSFNFAIVLGITLALIEARRSR